MSANRIQERIVNAMRACGKTAGILISCLVVAHSQADASGEDIIRPVLTSSELFRGSPRDFRGSFTDIFNHPAAPFDFFVANQDGSIWTFNSGTIGTEPFFRIESLSFRQEMGLLSATFGPNYPDKPHLYVYYASDADTQIVCRLSRFTTDEAINGVIANSEEILLEIPTSSSTHLGGQIRFGGDGLLYLSIGDSGGPGRIVEMAQDPSLLFGKILRIDPESAAEGQPYAIPSGNPFIGVEGKRPEILALGLRNPWRFDIHPTTGDLYIGDVGESDREEINVLPVTDFQTGVNFGWPHREGSLEKPDYPSVGKILRDPVYEYSAGSAVVSAGFWPNAGGEPGFLFADFSGSLYILDEDDGEERSATKLLDGLSSVTCFGRDPLGNLYAGFSNRYIRSIEQPSALPLPDLPPSSLVLGPSSFQISSSVLAACIRYTTDGSDPDENSLEYDSVNRAFLEEPGTLKARLFHPDYEPGPIASATYDYQVQPVFFSPGSYNLIDYTQISLSSGTPGAVIRYTTDNSLPDEGSPIFDQSNPPSALLLTQTGTTVRARAFRDGWTPSEYAREIYTMRVGKLFIDGYDTSTGRSFIPLHAPIEVHSMTPGISLRYGDGDVSEESTVIDHPIYPPAGSIPIFLGTKEGLQSDGVRVYNYGIDVERGEIHQINGADDGINGLHLALAPDGSIFVADNIYSPSLWKLRSGLPPILLRSGQHSDRYTGLWADANSDLYARAGGIWRFAAPDHQSQETVSAGFSSSSAFLVEEDGSFIHGGEVSGSNPPEGIIRREITGESTVILVRSIPEVLGLAKDPAGAIWVSTADYRINRFENGTLIPVWGSGRQGESDGPADVACFREPGPMVFDRIGNLYVVDEPGTYNGYIRKISPDGEVTTCYGPWFLADGSPKYEGSFFASAKGTIAVDAEGVIHGANRDAWRFVQTDWDNDGIPDKKEAGLGFGVGVDERKVDRDLDGVSDATEYVFAGRSDSSMTFGSVSIRWVTEHECMIAVIAEAGWTSQLEFSDDGHNWFPMGKPTTSVFRDMVRSVPVSKWHANRLFRWQLTAP